LKSDKDILWYTTITIGTGEGQEEFDVDVDTGSSDLFIPGVKCGANCDGHTRYDPLRSATSRDTGKKFNLDFADKSSVTGSVYTDSVSLGGLVAEGQGFGVGDVYSDGLARDIFSPDGLMGLGFQALSHIGSPPLIDTLYNQKKIKQRMFGVRLDLARLNGEQGELTLGGYNEHHVAGEITYTYVNDAKYWQVQLDEASVGSKVLASNVNFIVDTGSTLINADAQFVENLYSGIVGASRVENSKRWTLPCASIPTLVFTINGKQFPISVNSFSPGRISEGSDLCYGGVVANVEPKEPWIVGGVFLSSVYTVFDTDQKRVGFSAL
ncbi:aspartic peptidase domain-containing protein, partial [Chlamydoabsidia padenii]